MYKLCDNCSKLVDTFYIARFTTKIAKLDYCLSCYTSLINKNGWVLIPMYDENQIILIKQCLF